MKRGRLPLTALRSFEAAGRLESFTRAAEELFISQAAVSRQIRELETMLGQPLFERGHRQVELTPAGEALLSTLTPSFDAIGDQLDEIRTEGHGSVITVNAEPSFAACWLIPHLGEFQVENPTIDVNVEADARLSEFRVHEALMAIRHSLSETSWPRVESRHLANSRLTPVMSPSLVGCDGTLSTPADLLNHVLLHEDRRETWRQWFAKAGLPDTLSMRGPLYTDEGLTLQAALRGQGIALLDETFAEEDIRAGRLVRPFDISIDHGAYWIVARRFDRLPAAALRFVDWLGGSFAGRSQPPAA